MFTVEFVQVRKGYELNNYMVYIKRTFADDMTMWEWLNAKIRYTSFAETYYKITCSTLSRWAYVGYVEALR